HIQFGFKKGKNKQVTCNATEEHVDVVEIVERPYNMFKGWTLTAGAAYLAGTKTCIMYWLIIYTISIDAFEDAFISFFWSTIGTVVSFIGVTPTCPKKIIFFRLQNGTTGISGPMTWDLYDMGVHSKFGRFAKTILVKLLTLSTLIFGFWIGLSFQYKNTIIYKIPWF
ncbi:hypothetical protein ACJX0J_017560, partial [Zea mays]